MDLEALLRLKRTIRTIGFDDAPFTRRASEPVAVAGVVCAGTRFEGMVWTHVQPDGWDATATLTETLLRSKFLPQVHVVLLDGISLGGFNVIDLPLLAKQLERPCVSVMRRLPKLDAIAHALRRLPEPERRLEILQRAGSIHAYPPFYFQVYGAEPSIMAKVLQQLTDRGHVPEALRLAHLITSAVVKGESGHQA
ncbi:MAG: DUF99 family protein [Tildeniella nuda ZEHNDER 1965/U140]|jgi:hypothetical protein|nr:DUF99 family protein [Tildeniella nuda ZEHNDER 1965/U140]